MLFTDRFIHGGTERQFVQALRHLDREKYEILVGCLARRGPFLADVEAMQLPVFEFPSKSLRNWSAVEWIQHAAWFFRERQVDLVHAFDFYTTLLCVPAARRAGIPVLASRRDVVRSDSLPLRLLLAAVCRFADGVVVNSQAAGAPLARLNGSLAARIHLVRNSVDLAVFDRARAFRQATRVQLVGDETTCLVGTVSALRPEKQVDMFLRAAALAAPSMAGVQFVIVGDGSERQPLERLGAALGLAGRMIFLGDRADVPSLLGALDVLVLSSRTESSPNAVLEAMAVGKPVVATRVGGTPELVEDGATGYLVRVGDDAAMAARILELARNPELRRRMGAAGRARAEREFTPAQMARKLDELYQRLLTRRDPVARILQIGNYPPPVCGWSLHTQVVDRELTARGADSRVMDIGPGRTVGGRGCIPVRGGLDYAAKLIANRLRGFTFQIHVNGDSWKGYALALAAALVGRLTGKPAVLTFHAGPSQIYFPRSGGFWRHAFALLFRSCAEIICNHEPVKKLIEGYGVPAARVHAIPAYSTQYGEEIPVPLPLQVEQFLTQHEPRLFSYSLFRPEFTMDVLFESLARIREKYPRAGLLLAGPREVPAEAVEQMRRLGVAEAVLIPGNLPHAEFLTAVQRSDVFVRTHLRDGVCTSVLEALALGVPVVAAEDGLRPPSVITYAPPGASQLTASLNGVLHDLPGARARVAAPVVDNNVEHEVALLLAAGATGKPHTPPQSGREPASAEKRHVKA